MIDILCPVLGRTGRTEAFAHSLAENTTNPYRLVFLGSPRDNAKLKECLEYGEVMVMRWPAREGDFAKKINYGFEHTDNPWVLIAADDLKFYPNWDREALFCAQRSRRGVIGTNDLHNPLVKRARLSTHPFFSREYITEYETGTADKTGTVLCELYDHQYVDNEFCDTAMARGEWAFCRRSIVEHLHPYWKLAAIDSTYQKALKKGQQDHDLYISRSSMFQRRPAKRRRCCGRQ